MSLIRRAYAAYAARDVPAVFALLHPEVEIVQTTQLPWGGTYRGHAGARAFFGKLGELTEATPEPHEYIPAGEDVVAVGRLRGRARRSGATIDIPIAHVWTVRDAKLARFVAYIDTPAMLAALGASEPAGEPAT